MNPEAEKIVNLERPFSQLISKPSEFSAWNINDQFKFLVLKGMKNYLAYTIVSDPETKIFRSRVLKDDDFSPDKFKVRRRKMKRPETVFPGQFNQWDQSVYVGNYQVEIIPAPTRYEQPSVRISGPAVFNISQIPNPFEKRN